MLYITGIHDARQLADFAPASFLGRRRRIAIDLIDDIDQQGDPAVREALFERIVDARGAFKRTYRDRFAAFDDLLVEALRQAGLPAERFDVLDVAVSDGSTSLPLIKALASLTGVNLLFTATDLDGCYVKLWREGEPSKRVILSDTGQVVQIILPPFLFTHRESKLLFPVNRWLRPSAVRFAEALRSDWQHGVAGVRSSEILLVNPELKRLVETDNRVAFRAWDILTPWPGERAHCVRAMNVLNPGYFDAAQMRTVVRHLFEAVRDGGILAMGSNENAGSMVDGVICRRHGDRLVVETTVGRGFRAPDALAGFAVPAAA